MKLFSNIKSSLTGITLLKMGIRITIIVIAVTMISYWHVMSNLELQVIEQLNKYITERGQHESDLFLLAEDNHILLKKELLWQLEKLDDQDPKAEFERLFVKSPDGVIRNRLEHFDGTRQAGVYIGETLPINADIRRRVLTFYKLATSYGRAWHNRFQTSYFTAPENINVLYWPEIPNYLESVTADFYWPDEGYISIADKKHNPTREPVWTGLVFDQAAELWMISYVTPIDIANKHIGNFAHDIFLNELLDRTVNVHIEGAYNLIFREDGRLIAHPEYIDKIMAANGEFDILSSNDQHLINIFQKVKNSQSNKVVIENNKNNEYIAVTKINGPDWYFITVYPKSLLTGLALNTVGFILFLGILSLLIEIIVLFLVLRKQVTKPLQEFLDATKKIARGDFNVEATKYLPLNRRDEIGELAQSFDIMASQLKTSFDTLDSKVKERTSQLNTKVEELTQTRQELIQSEKMASLGRLVAGFAHELNTPLGVAVGSASALQQEAKKVNHLMAQEEIDIDELLSAIDTINKGFDLTLSNLDRAAKLVTSFKRTAVDQSSDEERVFLVKEVIDDIINTLHNRFKQTDVSIKVDCPNNIKIKSLPGALEQILTNFLMNSLIHGFNDGQEAGNINIVVQLDGTNLHIEYADDGKGIDSENLEKIFEPFFTTHRAHGGSGLGMYICYNFITNQLQGNIVCESTLGNGVLFKIDYSVEVV